MCGQSPLAFFQASIDVRPVTPWIFSCWLLPDSALLCQWNHSKTTHLNFEQYTKVHASLARNLQKTIQLHASDVWRKPEHNIYYHGMPLNYTIRHRKTSIFHSLTLKKNTTQALGQNGSNLQQPDWLARSQSYWPIFDPPNKSRWV